MLAENCYTDLCSGSTAHNRFQRTSENFKLMSENPYAAPNHIPTEVASSHNQFGHQYKPLTPLAKILLFAIVAACLCNITISAMDTLGEFLFPGFNDPNKVYSGVAELNFYQASNTIALLMSPVHLLSGILTAIFFYRANANLWSLGVRGLKYTPGWCAAFWFIPVVFWFKPYLAAVEIYKFSRPLNYSARNVQIGVWWTGWVALDVLTFIQIRMIFSETYFGAVELILAWVWSAIYCVVGLLYLRIIFSFAKSPGSDARRS